MEVDCIGGEFCDKYFYVFGVGIEGESDFDGFCFFFLSDCVVVVVEGVEIVVGEVFVGMIEYVGDGIDGGWFDFCDVGVRCVIDFGGM